MAGVFISYWREDIEFVQRLCHALKAKDCDSWVDWQDILSCLLSALIQ
ncbi:MAG: TIR domain-containing protein [Candidatus Poribacteria bacterium]